MKILGLEFSSRERSAAVLAATADGQRAPGAAVETGGPSTGAFQLIEQALIRSGTEREEIDCLVVGTGPGSYTGIRSAIALAQGWQLARPIQLLGISSVECLAAQAFEAGITGSICIAIDAQRNEFYMAEFRIENDGPHLTRPLELAAEAAVRDRAAAGVLVLGPEASRWFAESRVLAPSAAALVRLAASRRDFVSGENLEPVYLRKTQFVKAPPPRVIPTEETGG